jgi:predicted transcriptional regulator
MQHNVRARHKVQLPSPLPWNERDPVLGCLKGDPSYMLENLTDLLQLVSNGVHKDEVIAWPDPDSELTLGNAIGPIASSGLLRREGSTLHLSTYGKAWLSDRDPEQLIGVIHAHVRFIGEILRELEQKSMPSPALLRIAREKYGFGWTTGGAIFMRIKWLIATGLVKSYSHKYHLSEKGRDFLARLAVHEPEVDVTTPADLQPAPLAIEDLIRRIEKSQEKRSRASSFYIPGIRAKNGQIEALRTMVETCASPTRDEVVMTKAEIVFNTGSVSAEKCIRSLSLIGLIERVSSTEIAATSAGLAWTASAYPIDLARIIHTNIWYFGEIIRELETSGRLTFTEILQNCPKYSMGTSFESLKRGGLTARIALLRALGLIAKVSNHSYMTTPLGIAFYNSIPCIDSIDQNPGTHLPSPDQNSAESSFEREPEPRNDSADQLADRLIHAGRMSETPIKLETAAVEALKFLGLSATHIGGDGEPDGVVLTRPGKLGDILTIETKSAANGTVPEEQAKQATLADHREQHSAQATLYIGPGFERRLLNILDNDEQVAVISTSVLAEAVRRQVNTPLTPEELSPLLDPTLHETERRSHLLAKWKEKEDWALSMRGIIEILSREADSPMSDEELESFGMGWLDITAIRRSLRDLLNREVSKDLIKEVLIFLASPQLAIVEEIRERYRLRVSLEAVPCHFMYLGRRWLVGDRLFR